MIVSKNGKSKRQYKKTSLAWVSRQSLGLWYYEQLAKLALQKKINFLIHRKNNMQETELKKLVA